MSLKVIEKDGFVTVTCGDDTVTVVGHLASPPNKPPSKSSAGMSPSKGTSTFSIHVGLPTLSEFETVTLDRVMPVARKIGDTPEVQDLFKLSGHEPVVLVIQPEVKRRAGSVVAKPVKAPFAALHEKFTLK